MTTRILALAMLLPPAAGCAVGPRYTPPEIAVPTAWHEAAAPAGSREALERWWTTFEDPLLDDLIARAVAGNLDLKVAAARVREARAARGIAASAALPQVGGGVSYERLKRSEAVPPFEAAAGQDSPFGAREQDHFEAGWDALWEIDVFGGVKRDKEAALAQVQAAEEARRDVLVTLLADVARNYAELRGVQSQLAILENTLRSQAESRDLARARLEAGLGTELDVARAEGLLDATAARRPALEHRAAQVIHSLGVLLGLDPGALGPELDRPGGIPLAPPEVPPTLPSDLLARRPDLRRAERELAAATARIGVATADLFPRFSILGGFGRLSDKASGLSSGASQLWAFVPRVRWPIFTGGRVRANIRVQNARQEQALRQYEKAVLVALEEVENALSAHARELRRLESLRDAADASRLALHLATERYTSGLESFLSVLDAQRSVYDAEDQVVRSERDVAVSLIAIYKALGGGWSLDESPPTTADLQPHNDRLD
jgi:NodT family efflux transporter outer membrane factor (OMF) lipoprotein